jgi:hypothetical protein
VLQEKASDGRRRTPLSLVFPEVQHHQIGIAMLNDVAEELNDTKDAATANPTHSDASSVISTNRITSSMQARRWSYGAWRRPMGMEGSKKTKLRKIPTRLT